MITTDSTETNLANYRNQVLVLDFWFTNCGPCYRSFVILKQLKPRFVDEQIKFINICDDSDFSELKRKIDEHKIGGIHLFDRNKVVPWGRKIIGKPQATGFGPIHDQLYQIAYPSYAFIDKQGKVLGATGVKPSDSLLFVYYIEGALKGIDLKERLAQFKAEINRKILSAEFLAFIKRRFGVEADEAMAMVRPYRKYL